MTIEITYTLDQLKEKMAEFVAISDDTQEYLDSYTNQSLNKEALDNFTKWLNPVPDFVGWFGVSGIHSYFFCKEKPSDQEIIKYNMRKVIYKPEETE